MSMKLCWFCEKENKQIADDFFGDFNCESCSVQNSVYDPKDYQPIPPEAGEGKEEMGRLGDVAKAKSPFIRLEIGQSTAPMVYKAWKEITNSFQQESFRYTFDVETETGIVSKTLDVGSISFAMAMDQIAFGTKVIVTRNQKLDSSGQEIEDKSVYSVELAE